MSWSLFRYVLMASVRDKILLSSLALIAVGVSLSLFFGNAAVMEKERFALVFAAGGLRVAGVAALVLFVVTHIRRSFETKDVDFLLSRPLSRTSFLLSHALAFSFLALVLAAAICGALATMIPGQFMDGYYLWTFSVAIEYIIMVNVALFFAMVMTSAAAASLITMAFYVLARLIGQILGIIQSNITGPSLEFLAGIMNMISMVIPRLDLMGQTSWLIYESASSDIDWVFLLAQGGIFTALVLAAALVDLIRRQF